MHGGQTRQLCPIFAQSAKYTASHQETFRQTHVEGHFTKLTYPLQNCAQQHYFQQPKGGAPPPSWSPQLFAAVGRLVGAASYGEVPADLSFPTAGEHPGVCSHPRTYGVLTAPGRNMSTEAEFRGVRPVHGRADSATSPSISPSLLPTRSLHTGEQSRAGWPRVAAGCPSISRRSGRHWGSLKREQALPNTL